MEVFTLPTDDAGRLVPTGWYLDGMYDFICPACAQKFLDDLPRGDLRRPIDWVPTGVGITGCANCEALSQGRERDNVS